MLLSGANKVFRYTGSQNVDSVFKRTFNLHQSALDFCKIGNHCLILKETCQFFYNFIFLSMHCVAICGNMIVLVFINVSGICRLYITALLASLTCIFAI